MDRMELNCKSCGDEIASKNVNIDLGVAKCGNCGAMFSLGAARGGRRDDDEEREEVGMPKGMQVRRSGSGLQIRWRWFSVKFIILTFLCLFWNGFMVVWFTAAIRNERPMMMAFGSLHALVGLGLLYYTIAGYVNSTLITLSKKRLTIKHGPIPAAKNKDIRADQIKQVFCTEKIRRSRNGTHYSYEVHAILRGSKREKLLAGLERVEQGLYLEQEIEEFLEIEDKKVRGEVTR